MADVGGAQREPLLGHTGQRDRPKTDADRRWSLGGLLVMLAYLVSAAYYFYVRVMYTLDVGWLWYAYLFLALELMGCASIVAYALILTRRVATKLRKDLVSVRNDYVVRIMVPCYKEGLEIVKNTVMAAIEADIPPNCTKHVYLCDDGKDPAKQTWCEEVARRWTEGQLHYRRRPRTKGELNGKACNLNSTLQSLYETSGERQARLAGVAQGEDQGAASLEDRSQSDRLANEVIAVFDADMVCKPLFFLKTLPILDNCDMVLTPQCFYNVPMMADIFNHSNLHLWEYMLPAMDGWGCLSCTGTNFIIRAQALVGVGYFPEYTVTEDYALSLELGRHGYTTRYLNEYLAEGEAPEEIPNIFKQRHRWCTGHLQVFFGRRNPLFYSKLPLKMRIMYSMGAYSYICAALLTPLFVLAPILAIWFGIFPIDLNVHYPVAFSLYYGMTLFAIYYTRSLNHLIFLWFASNANLVLWYTYARAFIGVLISHLTCGAQKIMFEATTKTGPSMKKGGMFSSVSSGSLAGMESIKVETDPDSQECAASHSSLPDLTDSRSSDSGAESPVANESRTLQVSIPVFEPSKGMTQPLLPVSEKAPRECCSWVRSIMIFIGNLWIPLLTLLLCLGSIAAGFYLGLEDKQTYHIQMISIIWCGYNAIAPFLVMYYAFFQFRCLKPLCCFMAGFSLVMLGSVLYSLHVYYRHVYDYQDAVSKSLLFYEAQRSGRLPATNRIPWRGDSGLHDIAPNGSSLVGGYYDAGDTVKFGLPAAVSISFLAWGMIEFPSSFYGIGQGGYMKDTLRWGTDYFIRAHTGPTEFIAQVGNGVYEHKHWWGRPEDLLRSYTRVGIPVNATHPGSDVAGSTAAALAASSIVFSSNRAYSHTLLKHAKELYAFGDNYKGTYSDSIQDAASFYPSSSFHDDLAWGALWIYRATSDDYYLQQALKHTSQFLNQTEDGQVVNKLSNNTDWNSVGNAVVVLLNKIYPGNKLYKEHITRLLNNWINKFKYTPKKLAYDTPWGALRESANTAFMAMVYAKYLSTMEGDPAEYGAYQCWALFQLRYMLGDGGRSYVVGFGHNPPTHAHHQAASCPDRPEPCTWAALNSPSPNPHVIHGALVGGPDQFDHFNDSRTDFEKTEVALDYNAGFTGALAGVVQMPSFGKCYWGGGVFKIFKAVKL